MILNIKLNKNFTGTLNKLQSEYGEEFTQLNGLSEEKLSGTDFLDEFVKLDTVADVSIDGSSNVSQKDVVTLMKEMGKSNQKLIAYNKLYQEIQKQENFSTANKWFEAEWTKALYMHDANTSTFLPYCYAYDLTKLANEGLFFLENYNNKPPKHLGTFIQFVKEFINYTSNRTSGACGLPNLIPYMYYFWDRDVKSDHYFGTPVNYAKQGIQEFIYAVNQPYVRDGIQSAFTNTSVFDHNYLEALFGGAEFPDGTFMIDEIEGIMQFQKWFMEVFSDTRENNMFTFPVNTIALLKKEGKFCDEEFAKWAVKHNMRWNDSNLFVDDSVTSLSNCCRLKSNITDLGWASSIGGGALRVGSVKVSSINLARIALESRNKESKYLEILKERTWLDLVALNAQRHIIQRNVEKGLLKNYADGLIEMKTQYSTIGVIGIYETFESFGYITKDQFDNVFYTEDAYRFGKAIFDTINEVKDEYLKTKDYMVNIEQVPAETAASKLQKADILIFGKKKVSTTLPLYGNQFIPLGVKTTLQERIEIASAFDEFCNGGSILHINIDGPFTNFDQAWKMMNYVTDHGVTYFAFTTTINICKDNHAFYEDICPKCGKPVYSKMARIVGFFTRVEGWSQPRKEELKLRQWEKVADAIKILK